MEASREQMNLVVVGHVDHGKSTVVGRLLVDTGALPQGKLEAVRAQCERNARPFEYAFLLDALKDEQSQGITIDSARCFFRSPRRDYIIIDAPGHVAFLKNMVSGASRAEAALLVIDAHEGIKENSRRHGYLVSLLGIRELIVLVNKMDLVGYRQEVFDAVVREYRAFLEPLGVRPRAFVPVCALGGENLSKRSAEMPWYKGPDLLSLVDGLEKELPPDNKPLRLPVQDIYKFTGDNDERRIIAGTVETGSVAVGDTVLFLPSGQKSRVTSVESFNTPIRTSAGTGQATGLTLADELFVNRGEILCHAESPPRVASRLRVNIFWMGHAPLVPGKRYKLKLATCRVPVRLLLVVSSLDATDLTRSQQKRQVDRHDVAECVLETTRPVAFDPITAMAATGRFVIVDGYDIAGGGIILGPAEEAQDSWIKRHVAARETAWDRGLVARADRTMRNGHEARCILFCGLTHGREAARMLEGLLFGKRLQAYYLGEETVEAGLEAGSGGEDPEGDERIRKLGEIGRILTEAGQIFVTALARADAADLALFQEVNEPFQVLVVAGSPGLSGALTLPQETPTEAAAQAALELLLNERVIPDYAI